MSRYESSRIKFLLSTLPAEYQNQLEQSSTTSGLEYHSEIKPSRIQFITNQHHHQLSHPTASLFQSNLISIYYPAWSNLTKGTKILSSHLGELNSNLKTRDGVVRSLREYWFGNREGEGEGKEGEEEGRKREIGKEKYKIVIKDLNQVGLGLGGNHHHHYVQFEPSGKQILVTFGSSWIEQIYQDLFERYHHQRDIEGKGLEVHKEKDEILFQIEMIDLIVLASTIREDINELGFRNKVITSIVLDENMSNISEREVFGGRVHLESQEGVYLAICDSTKTRNKVTEEGLNDISSYLELGNPFPDLPFFKSPRAVRC